MIKRIKGMFAGRKLSRGTGTGEPAVTPEDCLNEALVKRSVSARFVMHDLADGGGSVLYVESDTGVTPKITLDIEHEVKRHKAGKNVKHIFWCFTPKAMG